jgi:hypothetical protein
VYACICFKIDDFLSDYVISGNDAVYTYIFVNKYVLSEYDLVDIFQTIHVFGPYAYELHSFKIIEASKMFYISTLFESKIY